MDVFRIVHERYANGLFASGRAGRWNETDQYIIYASSSRALATLELVVNRANIASAASYKVLVVSIPDTYTSISAADLPVDWRGLSAYSELQAIGSRWYSNVKSSVLSVPSAVIPQECNFLINARHPGFQTDIRLLTIEPYFWDVRLKMID